MLPVRRIKWKHTHRRETKHPCVFGLLCLPDDTESQQLRSSIQCQQGALPPTGAHARATYGPWRRPTRPWNLLLLLRFACADRVSGKSFFRPLNESSSGIFRASTHPLLSVFAINSLMHDIASDSGGRPGTEVNRNKCRSSEFKSNISFLLSTAMQWNEGYRWMPLWFD